MAHTEISAEKIAAYRATDYRFGEGFDAVILQVDLRSEGLARLYTSSVFTCGAFFTAYNPYGTAQGIEANEAAHARLGTELKALSESVIEGAGADASGRWPEEKSYFAFGINLEAASNLGKRYRQDAIVWAGSDAVPKLILLR